METHSMQSKASTVASTTSSHVQGVNATAGGLVKATLGAAVLAGAILTFVWLPAEHGIDPTGVGHFLGLTEMGHIKEQLHAQADADADAALAAQSVLPVPTANADIARQLEAIQMQLAAIAATVGVPSAEALSQEAPASVSDSAAQVAPDWRDERDFTLESGEGIEVKMMMKEGAIASFEWTANGAVVNHDTHGDGDGQSISYEKGRSVPGQAGQLTAAFTGNHGWYWRNRTDDPVVVTIRTQGDYEKLLWP